MGILGIYASQISGHLVTNSYESIATVTVGSGGSSLIEFNSIPNTYKHLQVRFIAAGSGTPALYMWLNTATGSYTRHRLQGNGSSASADGVTGQTYMTLFGSPGLATAPIFNAGIVDILDYANENKNKTFRTLAGVDTNGGGNIELTSHLYPDLPAISKLSFQASSGNISQFSQFALYGIKG